MRYQAFVRAAATVLSTALLAGTAFAQGRTMTDAGPPPATDRNSLGAVILMDQPVLAQREQMLQAQERYNVDTRTLGGPARVIREHEANRGGREQRARDANRSQGTPD